MKNTVASVVPSLPSWITQSASCHVVSPNGAHGMSKQLTPLAKSHVSKLGIIPRSHLVVDS